MAGRALHGSLLFSELAYEDFATRSVNVAVNKPASQFNTLYYKGFKWTADKAVDDCLKRNGTDTETYQCCSSTQSQDNSDENFWRLNLTRQYVVENIKVFARKANSNNQLDGFALYIREEAGGPEKKIVSFQTFETDDVYTINVLRNVSEVTIRRFNSSILTICEVQVFAACANGTFGINCVNSCGHCFNNAQCNKSSGICPNGCKAGMKGEFCNITCADGEYGINCINSCGKCFNNSPCNKSSGICPDVCSNGTWGVNCNGSCGNCLNNISCNHIDGRCISGCIEGWQGDRCLEERTYLPSMKITKSAVVIGGTVGGVVAFTVIVGALILWKRRTGSSKGYDSQIYTNPTILEESSSIEDKSYSSLSTDEAFSNVARNKVNTAIPVTDLRQFCRLKCVGFGPLHDEFETLPNDRRYETKTASTDQNRKKNLYKNMFAYDKKRVPLPDNDEDSTSDDINASFIQGYSKESAYIAAQGVIKSTINGFWQMVWSQNISTIVMLTRCYESGKLKCLKYWPEEREAHYGKISVILNCEETYADFTIRSFLCTHNRTQTSHSVTQFHFVSWPDKEVPDHPLSLVQFWRKVTASPGSFKRPWLIHSSAGAGRTGTFIALDYLYQQAKSEPIVDVFGCVKKLREDRANMVQTATQYVFLHKAVLEAVHPIGQIYSPESFQGLYAEINQPQNGYLTRLMEEFQMLQCETENIIEDKPIKPINAEDVYAELYTESFPDSKLPENRIKTRDHTILPNDLYRPRLMVVDDFRNDYINAVWLQTYRRKDSLIITQTPLHNTVVDFLRLIWNENVVVVAMMDKCHENQDVGIYWESKTIGPFTLKLVSQELKANCTIRNIDISLKGETRQIKQFQYTDWSEDKKIPKNTFSFLTFLKNVYLLQKTLAPIVVHCLNGADRSGLFCVVWTLLERLKAEGEVAIAETVRALRIRRSHIISDEDQYQFCYDVMRDHLNSFDLYANVL